MRYEVPQFIEIEDKIVGPLTFKQFLYVAGSAGASFVLYSLLPFFVAVLFIVPVAGLGLALAFYKHNSRPFIVILEAFFNYQVRSKFYIWKKKEKSNEEVIEEANSYELPAERPMYVPKLSDSKRKDLSWSLDIRDRNQEVL